VRDKSDSKEEDKSIPGDNAYLPRRLYVLLYIASIPCWHSKCAVTSVFKLTSSSFVFLAASALFLSRNRYKLLHFYSLVLLFHQYLDFYIVLFSQVLESQSLIPL
jgi:hypothetical protein